MEIKRWRGDSRDRCAQHVSQVHALIHSVHVYQSSDSIRDRRNSMKLQHAASVTCIL